MDFKIEQRNIKTKGNYNKEDIDFAYMFAKKAYKEFGRFLRAVVLFGSTTKAGSPERNKNSDIDILVIVDDVSYIMTPEIVEAYRIITEKIILSVTKRLHITTLKFTSFWEYMRIGDPISINILRDGVALIDTGFFYPMQILLKQGRIKPTFESVMSYMSRSPISMHNSRWHLLQATLDLYWAVVDSAHAALMSLGVVPPQPSRVADEIIDKIVRKKLAKRKYAEIMNRFYKISKKILHREIKEISGKEYESLYRDADDFVKAMRKIVESNDKEK